MHALMYAIIWILSPENHGELAQMVERPLSMREVARSMLAFSTPFSFRRNDVKSYEYADRRERVTGQFTVLLRN